MSIDLLKKRPVEISKIISNIEYFNIDGIYFAVESWVGSDRQAKTAIFCIKDITHKTIEQLINDVLKFTKLPKNSWTKSKIANDYLYIDFDIKRFKD